MGKVLNTNTVVTSIAAPLSAYVSTLIIWLINGIAFHCWIDPSTTATSASAQAAWTCPMHLPDTIATAITGILTLLGTGFANWATQDKGAAPTPPTT